MLCVYELSHSLSFNLFVIMVIETFKFFHVNFIPFLCVYNFYKKKTFESFTIDKKICYVFGLHFMLFFIYNIHFVHFPHSLFIITTYPSFAIIHCFLPLPPANEILFTMQRDSIN